MKSVGLELDGLHLCGTDLAPRGVFAPVQTAGHRQSLRGAGSGYQMHDGLVIAQRLAAPVRGDEGE